MTFLLIFAALIAGMILAWLCDDFWGDPPAPAVRVKVYDGDTVRIVLYPQAGETVVVRGHAETER